MTNASAIWNVSASYEGVISKEDFQKVIKKLREKNTVSVVVVEISDTSFRLTLSGLSYVVEYTLFEDENN